MSAEKSILGLGLVWILFWVVTGVCWLINLVQLISCDFEGPWKEEIIHLVGLVIAPASIITVWF